MSKNCFQTTPEQKTYENLIKELRCVTCPNQSVGDSQAPIAKAMQEDICLRLHQGESAAQIKEYMQQHYGDYVLYKPEFATQNSLLWFAPFVLLVLGAAAWFAIFRPKH